MANIFGAVLGKPSGRIGPKAMRFHSPPIRVIHKELSAKFAKFAV